MITDAALAADILEREWNATLSRLEHLAWTGRTRLEGWQVSDLAAHLVWGSGLEVDGLRRARRGETDPALGGEVPPTPGDQVTRLADTVGDLVEETKRSSATTHPIPMPYGPIDVAVARAIFVMEAAVHGSDVADAAEEGDELAPDVIAPTVAVLSAFLPVLAAAAEPPPAATSYLLVGESFQMGFVHTDAGWTAAVPESPTAVVRGTDSDVVLFALGRRPLGDLEVTGSESAAKAFKTHLPGL